MNTCKLIYNILLVALVCFSGQQPLQAGSSYSSNSQNELRNSLPGMGEHKSTLVETAEELAQRAIDEGIQAAKSSEMVQQVASTLRDDAKGDLCKAAQEFFGQVARINSDLQNELRNSLPGMEEHKSTLVETAEELAQRTKILQESVDELIKITPKVRKEAETFVDQVLAHPYVSGTLTILRDSINGTGDMFKDAVFAITPENSLHKAGFVAVGLAAGTLTWYLQDTKGVKYTLNTLKSVARYKKLIAVLTLAGGYSYEHGAYSKLLKVAQESCKTGILAQAVTSVQNYVTKLKTSFAQNFQENAFAQKFSKDQLVDQVFTNRFVKGAIDIGADSLNGAFAMAQDGIHAVIPGSPQSKIALGLGVASLGTAGLWYAKDKLALPSKKQLALGAASILAAGYAYDKTGSAKSSAEILGGFIGAYAVYSEYTKIKSQSETKQPSVSLDIQAIIDSIESHAKTDESSWDINVSHWQITDFYRVDCLKNDQKFKNALKNFIKQFYASTPKDRQKKARAILDFLTPKKGIFSCWFAK